MAVTLDELIGVWRATSHLHQFFPPADQKQIEAAEEAINVRLPFTFRKLYRFSNGVALFKRNK